MRYAIMLKDTPTAYWVTRAGETDNYTCDVEDATTFCDRAATYALMRALELDMTEHEIVEWEERA